MTPAQFAICTQGRTSSAIVGAGLVVIHGLKIAQAADVAECTAGAIYNAISKIRSRDKAIRAAYGID